MSCGVTDLGIFFDFASLHQEPRTDAQQQAFGKALGSINLWYSHKLTTVWFVTAGTDDAKGLSCTLGPVRPLTVLTCSPSPHMLLLLTLLVHLTDHEKGWTTFEYLLSLMIKPSNESKRSAWPQLLDLGEEGCAQTFTRTPPSEPLAFSEGHMCGAKVYTNGADRDSIVAPKFKQTIFELLGGSFELDYEGLGWVRQSLRHSPLCFQSVGSCKN